MYHGSDEELRAAEMTGRVYDNLCTNTPLELHGIRQVHTSHVGGASMDGENETIYTSPNTSANPQLQQQSQSQQQQSRRRVGGVRSSSVNSVVEIARRESVLRQIYNDKLRGSINAIFTSLLQELPRDHIFLQLLHDPSTEQYCKVRVGEVVESFLFSVQAHQYHNLAAELAKREVELLTLSTELETLEQQLHASPPVKSSRSIQTDNRVHCGMNTGEDTPSIYTTTAAVGGRNSNDPMEDAAVAATEAHNELVLLLEEVTREHELAKCRECLSAPTSLLEMVQAEDNYRDKYEYLADIVAHLFRSVKGLVMYAEGSLDSLDSLRHGLRGMSVASNNSNNNNGHNNNNNNQESENSGRSPISSSPNEPLTSNDARRSPSSASQQQQQQQRTMVFEEERARLEALTTQLKYAQRHCGDLIMSLGKEQIDLHRRNDEYQQQIQHLRQLAMSKDTKELNKALKANESALVQLREELQQSLSTERAKSLEKELALQQKYAQQTNELHQIRESLKTKEDQLHIEIEKRKTAEQRLRELEEIIANQQEQDHLSITAASDMRRRLELERDTAQSKLSTIMRELVVHRAEIIIARQESIVLDAYICKSDLLTTLGYERAGADHHYTLLLAKEAVRHAQSQTAAAQCTLREREETAQQCYEDLRQLLECMREDERMAEMRQRDEEAHTEEQRHYSYSYNNNNNNNNNNKSNNMNTSTDGSQGQNKEQKKRMYEDNVDSDDSDDNDDNNNDNNNEEEQQLQQESVRQRYGIPKTLTGIALGLQNAYEAVQRSHRHVQINADTTKEQLRQQQEENITLRQQLQRLNDDYNQQRTNFSRLWDEQAVWAQQDTLKSLLAKQEALLTAVNTEREALQARWSTLSEEYQTLERRNSQLHERCAAKEAENARLVGFLRAQQMTPPASRRSSHSNSNSSTHSQSQQQQSNQSHQSQQQQQSHQQHYPQQPGQEFLLTSLWSPPVAKAVRESSNDSRTGMKMKMKIALDEESYEVRRVGEREEEKGIENKPKEMERVKEIVGESPDIPHRISRASSSAAGLSGPARTSCGSATTTTDDDTLAAVHHMHSTTTNTNTNLNSTNTTAIGMDVSNSSNRMRNRGGVGIVVPLGKIPRDVGAWRTAFRNGRGSTLQQEQQEKEENV